MSDIATDSTSERGVGVSGALLEETLVHRTIFHYEVSRFEVHCIGDWSLVKMGADFPPQSRTESVMALIFGQGSQTQRSLTARLMDRRGVRELGS